MLRAQMLVLLLRSRWTWLVLGIVLIAVGAFIYVGAHPAAPVEVDGTISSYKEYTTNGSYDHNELQMAGNSNTYTLDKTSFHPTMPDEVYKDGKVSVWVDSGSTDVLAITLYDENDENPTKYTTNHYDNPASQRSDGQSAGIVVGVLGAISIGIFGLAFVIRRGPRRMVMQPAGGGQLPVQVTSTPAAAGTSIGLSPDGKWYWDGAQWRNASADGRYWWDGGNWQPVGGVATTAGAPPPVG